MKFSKNQILYVYSNIQVTKGKNRSILIDNQYKQLHFIPNVLAEIILDNNYKIPLLKMMKSVGEINKLVFQDYITFLLDQKLGIILNSKETTYFPIIESNYENPSKITNCLVDFNDTIKFNFKSLVTQLSILQVIAIEIRFFKTINWKELNEIMVLLKKSPIRNINLHFKDSSKIDINELLNIYSKVCNLYLYNCDKNEIIRQDCYNTGYIIQTNQDLKSHLCCGVVKPHYFTFELDHYFESIKFNTCLNKKISIDTNGNIKNCPSMKESFGNINETRLIDVVNNHDFYKYYSIKKDDISVCKDCEFRHICTDCRAYIESPDDIYSKPLKCGYDPFTNKWEEWSANPLKQKAIDFYGLKEILPN